MGEDGDKLPSAEVDEVSINSREDGNKLPSAVMDEVSFKGKALNETGSRGALNSLRVEYTRNF